MMREKGITDLDMQPELLEGLKEKFSRDYEPPLAGMPVPPEDEQLMGEVPIMLPGKNGYLSVYNMIIMRSFFYGIPDSLRESAEIDGASFFQILWKIYVPLSKPVFATLALFYAVGRWNGYSDALMYVKEPKLYPLQLLLYNILNNINQVEVATQEGFSTPGLAESLKAAIVMFSTIPILLIYPWLQKYFIHGVTLGAVKE